MPVCDRQRNRGTPLFVWKQHTKSAGLGYLCRKDLREKIITLSLAVPLLWCAEGSLAAKPIFKDLR